MTTQTPDARLVERGREVLAKVSHSSVPADVELSVHTFEDGSLVVAQAMKGGIRVYVAPDLTVLVMPSFFSDEFADKAFARGERTRFRRQA